MCCFSFLYYRVVVVECKFSPPVPEGEFSGDSCIAPMENEEWRWKFLAAALIRTPSVIYLIYNKGIKLTMVLAMGRMEEMEAEMPKKSLGLTADQCWHCQIFQSPCRAIPGIHFVVSILFGAFQPCPVLWLICIHVKWIKCVEYYTIFLF